MNPAGIAGLWLLFHSGKVPQSVVDMDYRPMPPYLIFDFNNYDWTDLGNSWEDGGAIEEATGAIIGMVGLLAPPTAPVTLPVGGVLAGSGGTVWLLGRGTIYVTTGK
jgi:hypothetical protein